MASPGALTDENQLELQHALARIAALLAGHPLATDSGEIPATLAHLTEAFGLSEFERDLLLLCAGIELDAGFPGLCASAQSDPSCTYPTFSLALAMLPGAHWSALSPDAPLRHWRLIEIGAGSVLTRAALRIDERILHFLAGIQHTDSRLGGLITRLPRVAPDALVASHRAVAAAASGAWAGRSSGPDLAIVQLNGTAVDCHPIAAAAAEMLELRAAMLPAESLPHAAADLDALLRLWDRETVLSGLGILVIDADDAAAESEAARSRDAAISRLIERATGPLILRQREPRRITTRPAILLEAGHPTTAEQLACWREALPAGTLNDAKLATTAGQFSLSAPAIRAIAAEFTLSLAHSPPSDPELLLWGLCRQRLRVSLDGLAARISSQLSWDDLVLPSAQKDILFSIAAQLRQRARVQDEWGFAEKSRRGLGLSALFHGPSGTGKTMAAEVLASALQLDLYHIDLSRIVSKYIGETETNLRKIFDAAEENGAILLFDEADSLFGTRSEVKDSHDRYANIEVSYLLQRMEAYRGLAILTTNMRTALDPAFMRRIRFSVSFPFPDAPQRAEIWRHVFPKAAPIAALDSAKLANLRVAGGNIRNIALNAAFLAADEGSPPGGTTMIEMRHLRAAAEAEYAKLDRRLTQTELLAWG